MMDAKTSPTNECEKFFFSIAEKLPDATQRIEGETYDYKQSRMN